VFAHAPLEGPANPQVTPNPAKAPWYFLWLQELVSVTTVKLGSITLDGSFIGGVVIPGLLILFLCIWPYLDKSPAPATGVWFGRKRTRQNIIFIIICLAIILLTLVGTYMRGPYWELYLPWEPWHTPPRVF
jgi:cytochrome b-561